MDFRVTLSNYFQNTLPPAKTLGMAATVCGLVARRFFDNSLVGTVADLIFAGGLYTVYDCSRATTSALEGRVKALEETTKDDKAEIEALKEAKNALESAQAASTKEIASLKETTMTLESAQKESKKEIAALVRTQEEIARDIVSIKQKLAEQSTHTPLKEPSFGEDVVLV